MVRRLTTYWRRLDAADPRQLPLFPERSRSLARVAAAGFALGLVLALGAILPPEGGDRRGASREPSAESGDDEAADDLAAISDHIRAAAARHRVSEKLITAVITVESGFDPSAVSRKGARGLMQLMPRTSALIGVRDPHSVAENIDAGAHHLRAMLDTFTNDLPLALAAYNAGERAVVKHRGIPPYPETRRFVTRVLRKLGDRRAEKLMARPVPAPRWASRTPRPGPAPPAAGPAPEAPVVRPTMVVTPVPTPADTPARASRALRPEPDAGDGRRAEKPSAEIAAPSSPPELTAPASQSP